MADKAKEKMGIVTSHDVTIDKEYVQWINDIKKRYRKAQIKTAIKVNSEQLLFNWQLGRDLVLRRAEEKWGKGVVEQLSLDLQREFPGVKGFGTSNLWYMKKWYQFYANVSDKTKLQQVVGEIGEDDLPRLQQIGTLMHEKKLQQVVGEIEFPTAFSYVPWGHHILIISKCKTIDEALFYIKRTAEEGLSRNALDNSIRADMYHSLGSAVTNFKERLPLPQGELAEELLKENYDLGFIALPEKYDEKILEDAIEQRMAKFLLELGEGWAFVGRQKEIIVSGKTRRIDLLFYHIYLRCYVVLELKVQPFEPEFAGKLNFYVNAVNEFVKKDSDNPTIGLLICKDMDRTEVQLAFQGITTPMGVATYDNVKIKEIEEHLPSAEQIREQVKIAEEEYKMRLEERDNG
jgi:predicted nuclease of restriction endonuclease-like (RecB) superfamily